MDALHLAGHLHNGVQTTVSTTEVEILAANDSRKKLILKVVSGDPVRVGTTGVAGTTGFPLASGDGLVVFEAPFCPTNAVASIQQSALTDAEVFCQEVTG